MQWQEVTECNFCDSSGQTLYLESNVPSWHARKPMRLVECTNCGLVYISPRPELVALYKSYIQGSEAAQRLTKAKLERTNVHSFHREQVEIAVKYLGYRPKRLYDMGCGAGTIMMAARDLGIEAYGNDINKASVDMLHEMGLNARHGFTQDIEMPDAPMDIIINFDYLEHTYRPFDDLKRCLSLLKPGGLMHLRTLYLDCPDHRQNGEAWNMFGCGHFYFFTEDVLKTMVERAGFEVIDTKTDEMISVYARKPGGSMTNLIQYIEPDKSKLHKILVRIVNHLKRFAGSRRPPSRGNPGVADESG
jgi:2-polyprenyl-3-methyl-5-hydroxy-6-metoxy-1,4-benzoquinol methylase